MTVGFVNSAAIILRRCAWQGCYGSAQTKTRRFRSSLANAHVASCGWLGIHEVGLQAFGFPVNRGAKAVV